MSLFKSRTTKEKESALAAVVAVMYADGQIQEAELMALQGIASRLGLGPSTVRRIMDNPTGVPFTAAESELERARQLVDMIMMMIVDGSIDDGELQVLQTIGNRMGFDDSKLEDAVSLVVTEIDGSQFGVDPEILAQKILGSGTSLKLTLKYYLGNIDTNPPRVRTQVAEAEVDDSFFHLDPQEKQKLLMEAGRQYLRPGEEVGGVEVVEDLRVG